MDFFSLLFIGVLFSIIAHSLKTKTDNNNGGSNEVNNPNHSGSHASNDFSQPTQPHSRPQRSYHSQRQEVSSLDEKAFGEVLWLAAGAAYSGGFTPGKGSLIQKWVQREMKKFHSSRTLSAKAVAKEIMTTSPHILMNLQKSGDFSSIGKCSKSIRVDAYDLVISVMVEDKKLSQRELSYLSKAENYIGLDHESCRLVKDKFFFGLDVASDVTDQELLTLLNVRQEWPKSTKLEFLTKEFTIWNSRSQGGHPNRRRAAIQRLSLIGRARAMVVRD